VTQRNRNVRFGGRAAAYITAWLLLGPLGLSYLVWLRQSGRPTEGFTRLFPYLLTSPIAPLTAAMFVVAYRRRRAWWAGEQSRHVDGPPQRKHPDELHFSMVLVSLAVLSLYSIGMLCLVSLEQAGVVPSALVVAFRDVVAVLMVLVAASTFVIARRRGRAKEQSRQDANANPPDGTPA